MRPQKESYASSEDLAWFNLEKYADLKNAPFQLWATVIRDRVELARFLDAGQTEVVTPLFEQLAASPLSPLGFAQRYSGGVHASDTPTIKPITANRIRWLHDAMLKAEASDRTIVDSQLQEDPLSMFSGYAHVIVDLRATDKQLCEDFASWLKAWRNTVVKIPGGDYRHKVDSWASAQVVPYFDLLLFSRLTGKAIEQHRKMRALFPKGSDSEHEAQRRRLSDMTERVFNDETALVVQHLAERSNRPKSE